MRGVVHGVVAVWASLGGLACTNSTAASSHDGGASDVSAGNPNTTAGNQDTSVGDPDTSANDEDASGADAAPTCQSGSYHVDSYAPPMMKVGSPASGNPDDAGASSHVTFVLESDQIMGAASSPAEPFTNVFTLKLMDSSGQPVKDATVTLPTGDQALGWTFPKNPWMPLHGHGSSITPTITNNGDGTYSVSTYFFMAGLWQMYLVAQTTGADAVTDSAMYSFCLQ
jgi:hypothetical protein